MEKKSENRKPDDYEHSDPESMAETPEQQDKMPVEETIGRTGPVGEEQIRKALEILNRYKSAKNVLDERLKENEKWYQLHHWEYIKAKTKSLSNIEPTTAWTFNSIFNKHADALDNYPQPRILPRAESDVAAAQRLSSVLPCVFEQNRFLRTYSENWWEKLKNGTAVYGVFWNSSKFYGLGDVDIVAIDPISIFFEPKIKNIQNSKNVFTVEMEDSETLYETYPFLEHIISGGFELSKFENEETDTDSANSRVAVIDWYYKKDGLLQYCKFAGNQVIYASENDPNYKGRGYYAHNQYPFVFDTLFPIKDSPCGFGFIDICKSPQMYVDKLNQTMLKSAIINSNPRYFASKNSGVNVNDFLDIEKPIVECNSVDVNSIVPIAGKSLDSADFNMLQHKIDEIKETSGNRDFSQGSTATGVTSGSAIAALQEAGSKGSRDIIRMSYEAYKDIVAFVIELMRQFYDMPRYYRITEEDKTRFVEYDNSDLLVQNAESIGNEDMGQRLPIFDIEIRAEKSSPFSQLAINELAKELYAAGAFDPQRADQALIMLEMMNFEGKSQLVNKIKDNRQNYMMQQMAMQQTMNRQQTQNPQQISSDAARGGNGISASDPISVQAGAADPNT